MTQFASSNDSADPGRVVSAGVMLFLLIHLVCQRLVPIDFNVYWQGGSDVLRRTGALYAPRPALPFTYPPFAGLVFAPGALLRPTSSAVLMELLSCVATAYLASRVIDLAPRRFAHIRKSHPWCFLVLGTALMCGLNPVWETLAKGQINLILAAVCLFALTTDRRFTGGVLVGLCGGIKLTPLALGLVALRQRDWRFILGMGCGFAGSIAAGLLLLPVESRLYWGRLAWDPARTGEVSFAANTSLNAVIRRLAQMISPASDGSGTATTIAWGAAVTITVIAGFLALPRDRARPTASLGVGAAVMLLISPVSWNHHWVWIPFIAMWASTVIRSRAIRWLLGILTLPIVTVGPLLICRAFGADAHDPQSLVVWWVSSTIPLAVFAILLSDAVRAVRERALPPSPSVPDSYPPRSDLLVHAGSTGGNVTEGSA
mgnify:CR=1 FL=1